MSKAAMMRMRGGRFLVLGGAGLDLFAEPPGAPIAEAARFASALGGAGAHIAAGVAGLGGIASLIACVADDAVGGFVRNRLHALNVGTEHVRSLGCGLRTSLSLLATHEEPQSVIYRSEAADLQLEPEHLAHIDWDRYDALIVSGGALALEPARAAAFSALMRARSAGLALILDIDSGAEDRERAEDAAETLKRAARGCDVVFGDERDFAGLSDDDGLAYARGLVGAPAQIVVYRKGSKGAFVFAGNETFYTPVHSTTALAPACAASVFLAAFALGLAEARTLRDCAARGAAAAAIVASREPGAPALPAAEELEVFLKAHPALQVIEN